ncbi:MAG: glycosyltransferase [Bacteroidetes bacterium]|nr:glycosyltransferase [Bacteroidota bacterium]
MKKILYIITARGVGGLERRFANLYKNYANNKYSGYQFTFLVSRAMINNFSSYDAIQSNPDIKLIKFGLPVVNRKSKFLQRVFRYFDYLCFIWIIISKKIIINQYYATHFVTSSSLLFRKLINSRIKAYSVVASIPNYKIFNSKTFQNALKEKFHIDCLSKGIKNEILSLGISDNKQLYTSPCSFTDYSKAYSKKKKKSIVFVGRFIPFKGINLLLSIIPIVCQRHKDLKIKILGYGPKQKDVEALIEKHNLFQSVYIGFSKEPMKELKESMIFLTLQHYENYPSQSLLEAMACENAIIATDVGLTREIINKDVGILISKNKDELIEAIDKMLEDVDRTMQMGKTAREKVINNHTVERYTDYLLSSLYTE